MSREILREAILKVLVVNEACHIAPSNTADEVMRAIDKYVEENNDSIYIRTS